VTKRNCDGDPNRTTPVYPDGLPAGIAAAIATTACPMRVFQDPAVDDALTLHDRVSRWGWPGSWEDRPAGELEAVELVDAVMATPLPGPAR
jgi:hypothetical protein